MEEKRRDAGTLTPANASESPASETPSTTRRRGGAHKRKASSAFGSPNTSSSSAPSKRSTREKASLSHHHHHHHNGPLTRARQSPGLFGSSSVKIDEPPVVAVVEPVPVVDKVAEKREALEAEIDLEFEAIKSRDVNVHVVPAHCGWFSWTKLHTLEECALPSFFNKKTDSRSPDMYMEIRNWIMKRFHASPNTQIEAKDLSELGVGDIEARQEVMEFLEYWGLINFHPRLPADSDKADIDGGGEAKRDSLLEKLYSFETAESSAPFSPKNNVLKPAVSSGLFPESAFAEELMRQEGPAVEYHCDSCSADCSRKRYHCQKEADFDLCTDCFNNGKFGSNMSSSDFILMEPAELHGVTGGKWTDQETLLLLEALELYKENWNEIAEHVATKTKAQCMLHFVQMPIEDVFLDCENGGDGVSCKEKSNPAAVPSDSSTPTEAAETIASESAAGEPLTQTSKPEEASEEKNSKETPKEDDTNDAKASKDIPKEDDTNDTKEAGKETSQPQNTNNGTAGQEALKPEDSILVKVEDESGDNLALKALREAFENIGYALAPEGPCSFAEVGNPVMAVAAFLARLVGPDLASASAHCSLKSLSGSPPGLHLAMKHCYCLEDPPDEVKELFASERVAAGLIDLDAQKDEIKGDKLQRKGNSTSGLDSRNLPNDPKKEKVDVSVKEKEKLESLNDNSPELHTVRNVGTVVSTEKGKSGTADEASRLQLTKDHHSQTLEKSNDGVSNQYQTEFLRKDSGKKNPVTVTSQSKDATMDVDIEPNSQSADAKMDAVSGSLLSGTSTNAVALTDCHGKSDSSPAENVEKNPVYSSCETGAERMSVADHTPFKENDHQQLTSNALVESGEGKDNCKDGKKDNAGSKNNQKFDNVKRAAVSALTAAAVKAKLLADQEEEEIQKLASTLIEKQLYKLETKLSLFNEMDGVTMRLKEQLEKSRQRLYHERAQIIASRLGMPAASSRGVPTSFAANRMAMNFPNSNPRAPMFMAAQRPPISRSTGTVNTSAANPIASSAVSAGPVQSSSSQEKLSFVGTK